MLTVVAITPAYGARPDQTRPDQQARAQSGPPSPPELPEGTTITRSSLGTGVPRPSLLEVVSQSSPVWSPTTVSSRPYRLSTTTDGVPVKPPLAFIEMLVSCCLSNDVLTSRPAVIEQFAAPPSAADQVHIAWPESTVP